LLKEETELSRRQIDKKTGFDKSKTIRLINSLINKNIVVKMGSGASVTYKLK